MDCLSGISGVDVLIEVPNAIADTLEFVYALSRDDDPVEGFEIAISTQVPLTPRIVLILPDLTYKWPFS